jgi:hypothetical protein
MRSFMISTAHPILCGDKMENEMGGSCSSDGGGEACIGFWWETLRERDHWGDPGIDGNIILRWIFRTWDVGLWTGLGLPQDR